MTSSLVGSVTGRRWTATIQKSAAAVAVTAFFGWLSALEPTPVHAGPSVPVAVLRGGTAPPAPERVPSPTPTPTPTPRVDCTRAKCVALTFDDGPAPGTGRLLNILARQNVKATFFLIGRNAATYPDLVRREVAEGHEVANHSWSHTDLGRSSRAKVESELARTQNAIRKAGGVTPVLMRPPYGSTDERVAGIARRMKLAQVLWAVDPFDWRDRNTRLVERRVLKAVRPGMIVLLHDIHGTTVEAVSPIIERLRADGYTFVTVSQLFGKQMTPGEVYVELSDEHDRGMETADAR
ncbi:MAG: polysaccharide deacetylase family protein [Actinomadura rubrobrunea]|nr:polysaccharide deacetylase family protein [Actinomadura rubrobrunea]